MPELRHLLAAYGGNDEKAPDLAAALGEAVSGAVAASSLRAVDGGVLALADKDGRECVVALSSASSTIEAFAGRRSTVDGLELLLGPADVSNGAALRRLLPNLTPRPLGLAPSFGFGDRIGLATPGHAAAVFAEGRGLAPIFCQQSIREMERTERTPDEVMRDAAWGAFRAGWTGPVGADADHLKTFKDVDDLAKAGFTFFTIDPSDHVDQQADDHDAAALEARFQGLLDETVEGAAEILDLYLGKSFDLGSAAVAFDEETLKRAAVKYGRALAHIYAMAARAEKAMEGRPFELEISVDETEQPTTIAEHLFLALELKRRGVPVVSLAPRFIGDFEKGVDYKGDLRAFEDALVLHAAVAEAHGPYKISLHSGSDKFGVYPLIGRVTKGRWHVKTAGTSYLEALRAAGRADKDFFRDVVAFSRGRFDTDKATYHISATLDGSPPAEGQSAEALERAYLDEDNGRQILHVTFGSVLTVRDEAGASVFKDRLTALLKEHGSLHEAVLAEHLGKHLRLLGGRSD